jgi:hypothetical protein
MQRHPRGGLEALDDRRAGWGERPQNFTVSLPILDLFPRSHGQVAPGGSSPEHLTPLTLNAQRSTLNAQVADGTRQGSGQPYWFKMSKNKPHGCNESEPEWTKVDRTGPRFRSALSWARREMVQSAAKWRKSWKPGLDRGLDGPTPPCGWGPRITRATRKRDDATNMCPYYTYVFCNVKSWLAGDSTGDDACAVIRPCFTMATRPWPQKDCDSTKGKPVTKKRS